MKREENRFRRYSVPTSCILLGRAHTATLFASWDEQTVYKRGNIRDVDHTAVICVAGAGRTSCCCRRDDRVYESLNIVAIDLAIAVCITRLAGKPDQSVEQNTDKWWNIRNV